MDRCTSAIECGGAPVFDTAKSSTFKLINNSFAIEYGKGTTDGSYVRDVVSMGGFTNNNQVFATADNVTDWNQQGTTVAGLMGLAWQTIATNTILPFWQAVSSTWDSPMFSMYLGRETSTLNWTDTTSYIHPGGQITLGGTDTSKYTGSINWVSFPATAKDYWRIPLDGISINGQNIDVSSSSGGIFSSSSATNWALIDSGTSLIMGPYSNVDNIYAAIRGSEQVQQGVYVFPCDTLPSIQVDITFGGVAYRLYEYDMIATVIPASELSTSRLPYNYYCVGAFQGMAQSQISWIFGDTFMKNVYSVFRMDPPAIGFATLADSANNTFTDYQSAATAPIPTGSTSSSSGSSSSGNGSGSGSDTGTSSGSGSGSGKSGASGLAMSGALLAAGLTVSSLF